MSITVHHSTAGISAHGRGGIRATLIKQSFSPDGTWVNTYSLVYPRFIHAEAKTHRVLSSNPEEYIALTQDEGVMLARELSRNAASSRAIPVAKMIAQVRDNPAMPIHWGKNQPGMQANVELQDEALFQTQQQWLDAAVSASYHAEKMNALGAHKQVVNRILEPFQFMHTIVTATDWDNFFALRCHPDAQPEIQELANCIKTLHDIEVDAHRADELIRKLWCGQGWHEDPLPLFDDPQFWHLPYVTPAERRLLPVPVSIMASAARCARVSYLTHEGDLPDISKDIGLFFRLVGSEPLHASPIEHQAACVENKRSNNFSGCWVQFRELYEWHPKVREHFNTFKDFKP